MSYRQVCPTMSRCNGSWFGHHKFEPRYDAKMPPGLDSVKTSSSSQIEAIKDQTYVHDICVRCGEIIERSGDAS